MPSTPENYRVITGQAYYCNFITPESYKGGPEIYKGRILIKEEDATDLMAYFDETIEEHLADCSKGTKKRLVGHQMYSFSDKFEGMVAVTFKQNYSVPTKDGGVWHPIIPIYNRKAERDELLKVIPNGSLIKVAWSPRPWGPQGNGTCGITMQPTGVQVIDIAATLDTNKNPFGEEQGNYDGSMEAEAEVEEDLFKDEGTSQEQGDPNDF
jgi:hypothetical protein